MLKNITQFGSCGNDNLPTKLVTRYRDVMYLKVDEQRVSAIMLIVLTHLIIYNYLSLHFTRTIMTY